MSKERNEYPAEYRRQIVDVIRSGRATRSPDGIQVRKGHIGAFSHPRHAPPPGLSTTGYYAWPQATAFRSGSSQRHPSRPGAKELDDFHMRSLATLLRRKYHLLAVAPINEKSNAPHKDKFVQVLPLDKKG